MRRSIALLLWSFAALWAGASARAFAQISLTPIADTVYHADGSPATGTVLVSWGTFTTASGQNVPRGSTSFPIAAGGALNASLAPNAGAMPVGTYYTVVYHLDDGSSSREYWVVPVSSSPVQLSAIRSSVLPSSIAMKTVTKQYVDQAIAQALNTGVAPADTSPYVLKTGDTMTGALTLPADPTSTLQAATKGYVDTSSAALQAGLAQKVSTAPSGTQVVTQPASTQLEVSNLNGTLNAKNYVSGSGGNGIANALASSDCTSGCTVNVDPTYNSNEVPALRQSKTTIIDKRGGSLTETFLNPQSPIDGLIDGKIITLNETIPASTEAVSGFGPAIAASAQTIVENAYTGGNNFLPQDVGGPVPYFKSTYSATSTYGNNYTAGQHVLDNHYQYCYGVGDCLMGSQFLTGSGGQRDNSDEGIHPYDLIISEDTRVFQGTCASGCTTGSTQLTVTPTSAGGTQGDGRYLINTATAKTIRTGQIVGTGNGTLPHAYATFTGTSFPTSSLYTLAAAAYAQTTNIAPGTLTMPIQTSGLRSGYSGNTATAPAASGVACVADAVSNGGATGNFETALYSIVDGTHFQVTLSRPHSSGATLAIGGLCGYGVEQTVDTRQGIRQVFPIIASPTASSLYYEGNTTAVVGNTAQTSGYANLQIPLVSLQRSGGVVTATSNGNLPQNVNGLTLTIANAADSSYNGSFAVTTTAANQFTYTEAGADSSTTGASASIVTGAFVIYPMAEVRSVFNAATASVDGTFSLAPNNIQWASGDTVEEPHFFQQNVNSDTSFVTQYMPRPLRLQSAGIAYGGPNGAFTGAGVTGWQINNATSPSTYYGNGGTHVLPQAALQVAGPWSTALDMQAGDVNAIRVSCDSHGCGRWDSTYNLFSLQNNQGGYDAVTFAPSTSVMNFILGGTQYSMSPTGFTAPTVNATTLNATRINGSTIAASATIDTTNAANITSGVLDPARLPAGYGGGGGGGSSVCSSAVAWSATPTFAMSCSDETFHMPLSGNVTSETFSGLTAGQRITLIFQVGATSGYTVQWSPAVHGGFITSASAGSASYTQAGKYLVQTLVVDTDGATLLNPGAINE